MIEIALYSAVAPLILLLLSSVWVYPAVLEEVVKWGIMRFVIHESIIKIHVGAIVGLVFGLSESILFINNAWVGGEWSAIGTRLLLTVPMHGVTGMVIALGMKYKVGWMGLLVAMFLHAGFNYLVD